MESFRQISQEGGSEGTEEEEGAEAFAAGLDDVAEEVGNDGVADFRGLGDARVDPIHIGAHRPEHVRALEGHAPNPVYPVRVDDRNDDCESSHTIGRIIGGGGGGCQFGGVAEGGSGLWGVAQARG